MRRARTRTISWCCVAGLVVGCGPAASDDGDGTGSATSGSTSSSTSAGASASSTIADATVGDDTTGAASTGADATGTTDGTETGEAACEPAQDVSVAFTVLPDESLSETCTVIAVDGDPGQSVITLGCNGQIVTLTVSTTPPSQAPYVGVDQLVHLEHVVDVVFWNNRWFALSTAGGESDSLLAGGVTSSVLDPPGTTLDAFFGGGLGAPTVAKADGLCMPLDDRCGPLERIALDFTLDELGTTRVFDHTASLIDVLAFGWAYTVEHATQYPGLPACDDAPPAWFDFVMVWFPSE